MGPIEKKEYKDVKFSRKQLSLPQRGEGGGSRCSKCLLKMDTMEANTNFSKTTKRSNNVHYVKEFSLSLVL